MVVVVAKSSLFVQSCRRSLHKVDVVCTKFCTKKEESWQVNFDIKTASYLITTSFRSLSSEVDLNYYRKTYKIAIYQLDVDKGKIISICNKFVKLIFGVFPHQQNPTVFLENNTFKENIVQGLLAF